MLSSSQRELRRAVWALSLFITRRCRYGEFGRADTDEARNQSASIGFKLSTRAVIQARSLKKTPRRRRFFFLVDQVALVDEGHVGVHHFLHQGLEQDLGLPVEQLGGLGSVPEELFHFSGAEVLGVHLRSCQAVLKEKGRANETITSEEGSRKEVGKKR